MAKSKIQFVCSSCQHAEQKWLGRCPECKNWNTFEEKEVIVSKNTTSTSSKLQVIQNADEPLSLEDIQIVDENRINSGLNELNQVLGSGIVLGASVLVGGEPGIGKSTLLLQICKTIKLKPDQSILYISGEETSRQIKMRAQRLNVDNANLKIYCETRVQHIIKTIKEIKPHLLIIDSVQTLFDDEVGSIPGTINQIKFSCFKIIELAKQLNCATFFIGHVTKEGSLAGPKIIEHMVDTVIHFEQSSNDIRILRASKNRFGSTDEIGLFTMKETGLVEISNPEMIFMNNRDSELPYGVSIAPTYEGSRSFPVEIQSLSVSAKGSITRIFSEKIDSAKVSRIAAVLEKHVGIKFSDQDIYVNVAGGMKLLEVAIDLPLAIALYSARTSLCIPSKTIAIGEISLSGEIHPIKNLKRRIRSCIDMNFDTFIIPKPIEDDELTGFKNIKIHVVKSIKEAIQIIFS